VKDQRRKKLLTVGLGVMFTYARDIRLWQEQKGEPLNSFIYPYAESNGQTIKGFDGILHFAICRHSAPKTQEIEWTRSGRAPLKQFERNSFAAAAAILRCAGCVRRVC
jgi:hypothetical protein